MSIHTKHVRNGDEREEGTARENNTGHEHDGERTPPFSGRTAGFAITLTFLANATATALYPENDLLAAVLYPIGFVYIIMGWYQLYTENTHRRSRWREA